MALATLAMSPWRRIAADALSLRHPVLPVNHVALARLLALAWLTTGHALFAPSVQLPWIPWLDLAGVRGWWPVLPVALGTACALVTLLTPAVRSGALGLGLAILFALASARAAFAFNRLFVACLLVLIAGSGSRPLPRLQVAVLYLGAALDKLHAPDWRSGQMLGSFVTELARFGRLWGPGGHVGAPNPIAGWLAPLPPAAFAAASMGVIALELLLALAFARGWRWALGPHLAFHLTLVFLTGGTFGLFFAASLACGVLLVAPEAKATFGPFRLHWRDAQWRGPRAWALAALVWWPGLLVTMATLCGPWFSPAFVAGLTLSLALAAAAGPSASATAAQTG